VSRARSFYDGFAEKKILAPITYRRRGRCRAGSSEIGQKPKHVKLSSRFLRSFSRTRSDRSRLGIRIFYSNAVSFYLRTVRNDGIRTGYRVEPFSGTVSGKFERFYTFEIMCIAFFELVRFATRTREHNIRTLWPPLTERDSKNPTIFNSVALVVGVRDSANVGFRQLYTSISV